MLLSYRAIPHNLILHVDILIRLDLHHLQQGLDPYLWNEQWTFVVRILDFLV